MDDTREPRDTPRDEGTTAAAADAALARVRAADPAAGTTPDLPRLHARLAETTGVTFTDAAPADELAAARRRR
ncbi:hypothetical protein, partial [Cellulomonas iranensis]|uniref:hypothetical protein n=1 Tax=Cellulomonas iranensis TaxID=76862 RepID=UPI001969EB37